MEKELIKSNKIDVEKIHNSFIFRQNSRRSGQSFANVYTSIQDLCTSQSPELILCDRSFKRITNKIKLTQRILDMLDFKYKVDKVNTKIILTGIGKVIRFVTDQQISDRKLMFKNGSIINFDEPLFTNQENTELSKLIRTQFQLRF